MILEFKVENFLSIKEEQSLSLLASAMKDIEVGQTVLADSALQVMDSAVVGYLHRPRVAEEPHRALVGADLHLPHLVPQALYGTGGLRKV